MNRQVLRFFETVPACASGICLLTISAVMLGAAEKTNVSSPQPQRLTQGTAKPVRLAIGGFAALADDRSKAERSRRLADLLTTELAAATEFELVERAEIERVAGEATLSLIRSAKPAEAARVGHLLRADWLLVGTFMELAGTNFVVARVVDASTGVIRDLTCLPFDDMEVQRIAHALAEFAVNSRRNVPRLEQRTFLGVGGFEDEGVNNRHPELRKSIRLRLETAFRGTAVAVVERTMVNPLLEELRLQAVGLTTQSPAEGVGRPAFVLVDGTYQSVYEEGQQIELLLRVEEMGSMPRVMRFKAPAGDPLLDKVVAILRTVVGERGQAPPSTSRNEAVTQLERGKQRARLPWSSAGVNLGGYYPGENDAKRRQNIAEAIEAFEAALLLDPDLAEAKMYLAQCLLDPAIGRKERGRDFLKELSVGNTDAALAFKARQNMAGSYLREDDAKALAIYADLVKDAGDPGVRARLLDAMYSPIEDLVKHGRLRPEEGFEHVGKQLRAHCEAADWAFANHAMKPSTPVPPEVFSLCGALQNTFTGFVRLDDYNYATAKERLDALVPQLCDDYRTWAAHILIAYTLWLHSRFQPEQHILKRLEDTLTIGTKNPESIVLTRQLQLDYLPTLANWCSSNHHAELLQSVRQLQAYNLVNSSTSTAPRRTTEAARASITPAPSREPRRFSIGQPILTLPERTTFACDGGQIWLRDGFLPAVYDIATGTLTDLDWPKEVGHYITRIVVGKEHVWFGTGGSGLLELDKQTRRWRHYTEKDGLVLSKISALCLTEERLWIGFGHRDSGGAGFLDLKTRRITAFTPALSMSANRAFSSVRSPASLGQSPRNHVLALVETTPGEIWMAVASVGLQCYQVESGGWITAQLDPVRSESLTSLVASRRRLVLGANGFHGGATVLDLDSHQLQDVHRLTQCAPKIGRQQRENRNVNCLASDGDRVWVGGLNYLACIDPATGNVDCLAEFRDDESPVRCLQVTGDDLWVAVEKEIYRVPKAARSTILTADTDAERGVTKNNNGGGVPAKGADIR